MNKVSLLTVGKKLQDNLYLLSIYDLEPSGLIVHAYDQIQSKEYLLPISEKEVLFVLCARPLFRDDFLPFSKNSSPLPALHETLPA